MQLPAAQPLKPFDEPIAANVMERWNRAQALRTIAFDTSAELELKAAYAATSSPRFLVEAAQAAFDQGHFAAGMNYGRMAVVSFDSRKLSEVPANAWKVLYPLPYETVLRREAELIWAQEEPANMGAWEFVDRHLAPPLPARLELVSRPASASPAAGSATRHKLEQEQLVRQALGEPLPRARRAAARATAQER